MMVPTGASHCELKLAHRQLRECLRVSSDSENPDDPSTIWSMPLVLHISKQDPPLRHELLADAARAVVACCLSSDPAFQQPLRRWYSARIRKVARRARNSQWQRIQAVPGVTVGNARACVPSAVVDTHPEVRKLQISGTDLPSSTGSASTRPLLLVDASLGMSVGKAAAQVGHGAMLLAADMTEAQLLQWADTGFAVAVQEVSSPDFTAAQSEAGAVCVRDAGFTEIPSGSVTVIALH